MSDPNSTSPDILSDGPGKYILRPGLVEIKILVNWGMVHCTRNHTITYTYSQLFSSLNKNTCRYLTVLQLFLSSPRPTLRFAAVRTLNKVAMSQPTSVASCNLDLENLITDVNRSIATLAITTLLKV
jgi:hypothetical protein